jgi:transposase
MGRWICKAGGGVRGGRTTKIHALSDPNYRPCAFHLTPGQDADIAAAPALLALAPPMGALIVDKGYDGDGSHADVISRGDLGVKCPGAR